MTVTQFLFSRARFDFKRKYNDTQQGLMGQFIMKNIAQSWWEEFTSISIGLNSLKQRGLS